MKCKVLCYLLCVLFCFSSLGLSSSAVDPELNPFAGYNVEHTDSMPSYEDLVDVLDPYAPMLLVEPLYDYYAGQNFSLTSAITTSSNFIYWEDLPYGLDTIIISYSVSNTVYLLFLDGTVSNAMQQYWSETYGYCRVAFTSNSPIYRIGYNRTTGSYVSFYSKTGLACDHTEVGKFEGETVYSFAYTLAAGDYYVCVSTNNRNLYADMYLNGEYADAIFGSGQYPKKADISFELEKENNQTSKSIWETLKSVLQYIINLPGSIADSIKGFFTSLGDRISSFFLQLVEDIKGLFVPSEGFFDTYVTSFQDYFKDKFGLLYEIPESIISILTQFVEYEPATYDYGIDFPEVKLPILQNGKWENKVIIKQTHIYFDFIYENLAILNLYTLYTTVLRLIVIFLLINLIIRKANKVFGGGSG